MTQLTLDRTVAYFRARRQLTIWIGIGLLAFLVRIVFVSQFAPDREWSDAAIYDSIAQNLLAGNGYSTDGITPTRDRPPTYPFFLAVIYAIVGRSLIAVVVIQALLSAFTVAMVAWLATQVFDRRAGFCAAFLIAVYPAFVYYDTRILREGPTTFLLVATIFSAWRSRSGRRFDYGVTGGLIGIISLCRPETLVLLVPAILITSVDRFSLTRLFRPTIWMFLAVLALWTPWTVRNQQTFGSWSPVKAGIVSTIWYGSRWAETGGDEQTSESRASLKGEFFDKIEGATDAEFEDRFKKELSADLFSRPLWFVQMVGKKAVMYWKDANGVKKTLPRIHPMLPAILNTGYYTLLILAIVSSVAFRRHNRVRALVAAIVIYAGTYALLHVRNRYRVPLLPVVFILSCGGFWYLYDNLVQRFHALKDPLGKTHV